MAGVLQNNSWGGGAYGDYDAMASYFDDFVHNYQEMAIVVSAGNSGIDDDANGYVDENSISSPGTSKPDRHRRSITSAPAATPSHRHQWGSDYPTDPTAATHLRHLGASCLLQPRPMKMAASSPTQ
jgi:hypothetical protein